MRIYTTLKVRTSHFTYLLYLFKIDIRNSSTYVKILLFKFLYLGERCYSLIFRP